MAVPTALAVSSEEVVAWRRPWVITREMITTDTEEDTILDFKKSRIAADTNS